MFYLHRFPEVGYETAKDALTALDEQDARGLTELCVDAVNGEERVALNRKALLDLVTQEEKEAEWARQAEHETAEESVTPEVILEGDEEKFPEDLEA